ncbi:GIY-YIG endonuclease (mitochondrion) [Colletotrichum lupini]|uniref:GIY-YIG endonuclease n=1 Tax=Colletotrichum lupini TaxID=145971 RepID=A0A9Q8T9B8_9PEZI|nr:GIY-YIG endonuclease [Colletotrichum lupini]
MVWYDIDEKGYVNKTLDYEPAIYIYKRDCANKDKTFIYIGSSVQLASRVSSHRSRVLNWQKNKSSGSPIFYSHILKYGWDSFKFGILEHVNLSYINNIEQKKIVLLNREQYYLDSIKPNLNICKIADSPLGVKRDTLFSTNLSKARRGKSINFNEKIFNNPKVVTFETKSKLSLRSGGISVKLYSKNNNFINDFPTLKCAAKFLGVHPTTISKVFQTGRTFDNFIYKFEIKPRDRKVWIYDSNFELVKVFSSIKQTVVGCDISSSTLYKYIKSGKLYNNQFYFFTSEYKNS